MILHLEHTAGEVDVDLRTGLWLELEPEDIGERLVRADGCRAAAPRPWMSNPDS
jgi:hypothetical protein